MIARPLVALAIVLTGALLSPASSALPDTPARPTAYVPPVKHVFVINIENKGYDETWGGDSAAPYLARTLRAKGVLLNHYYGTAHNSQPNYIAQVSGQGPNPEMQADCQLFTDFTRTSTVDPDQAVGSGCVFPADVPTLPGQLTAAGRTWKGYMDDMTKPCQHPDVGAVDPTQRATAEQNYAARHNPFVYFHSIIDDPAYCKRHVVPLGGLVHDLKRVRTTPNLTYIAPDLCHDGHDAPCADGRPGGLASVNAWMKRWVPRILASPAFRKNGALIITADESDGPQADADACCGPATSANSPMPGILGPGGGKIGALVISKFVQPGSWSTTPYNHYSLLGSMEEIFGLPKLGYARDEGVDTFGLDVWNDYSSSSSASPITR
ncbi:alkaline phosphatase family protein [Nocardioides sp. URHA0032]|uniref:alkaline phosphatase family protein n=1 Tax=Nocardioides sp. URHA0032 TaxID=1380388 RepID=UPI00048EBF17|nr:alkaline phosphatase family protein [Nocardioides sp. URHA0032]